MSDDVTATTWRELRTCEAAQPDWIAKAYDHYEAGFSKRKAAHPLAATPLLSAVELTASAVVIQGTEVAKPLAAKLKGPAEAIAAANEPVSQAVLATLGLANLCACAGLPRPDIGDADALLADLRSTKGLDETKRQAVWAHLAWGVTEDLDAILPGKIEGKPDASAEFGPNVHGIQLHIARAITQGAGPESVEIAWNGFVDHFPRLLAAGQSSYMELLFAAHAVLARIGGVKDGQVLDRLRARIA
jgi:hypothetical protein